MKLKDLLLEKNFPKPSTLSLAAQYCLKQVLNKFGEDSFETIWGRNYRTISGTDTLSQHSYGNALDFMVFNNKSLGDSVTEYLLQNRSNLDIQNIIWNKTIWNSSTNFAGKSYTGQNSHTDHVHVDFTPVNQNANSDTINQKNNAYLVNLIAAYHKISSTEKGTEEYFGKFKSWNPLSPGIGDDEVGAADKLTLRFEQTYSAKLKRMESDPRTSKEDKENIQYIRQIVTTLSDAILDGKNIQFDVIYNKYNKDTKQYERKIKSFNWNYM